MKNTIAKGVAKVLTLALSLHLTKAHGQDTIVVNTNTVLSDVSQQPVGLCLNTFLDVTNDPAKARMTSMRTKTLRYPMGTYANWYLFNPDNPSVPKSATTDPDHFVYRGFGDGNGNLRVRQNFDQFIELCQHLGAEPVVMVGFDAALKPASDAYYVASREELIRAAADWVHYANVVKGYGVKYWEIGNENDLDDPDPDVPRWTAEQYAALLNEAATAMKAVDSTVWIGANGMTGDEWWNGVLPTSKNNIDFLVTHQYAFLSNYPAYRTNSFAYKSNIETAQRALQTHRPDLGIVVTEYSSHQPGNTLFNNLWKALFTAEMTGNIIEQPEVDLIHFWQSQFFSEFSTDHHAFVKGSTYELMPQGQVLSAWGQFLRDQMVAVSHPNQYTRAWASRSADGSKLTVYLLNKDDQDRPVALLINDYNGSTSGERWELTGKDAYTTAVTWDPRGTADVAGGSLSTTLPKLSFTVLSFGAIEDPAPGGDVQTREIAASEDTYVRNGIEFTGASYFDRNFGSAPSLGVRYNPGNPKAWHEAFLKFDLSEVVGEIVSAQLRLLPIAVGGSNHTVAAVDDDTWDADQITWENSRGLSPNGASASWDVATLTANEPFEVTITDLVATQRDGTLSVKLSSDANTALTEYASSEYDVASARPVLVVTYRPNGNVDSPASEYQAPNPSGPTPSAEGSYSFYPNPATDQLTVQGGADYRMQLYDLRGRPVMQHQHLRGRTTLNVAHLRPGVYLMRIDDQSRGPLTRRVIIR